MIHVPLIDDDVIYKPAYTIGQAARFAQMHSVTVRRWLLGYRYENHEMQPVFGAVNLGGNDPELMLSFIQLCELVVANRFRQGDAATEILGQRKTEMPLRLIRDAHKYAREKMGVDYPFANLRLQSQGGHILHEFEESTGSRGDLALDAGGNWVLPGIVSEELEHFKYQQDGSVAE